MGLENDAYRYAIKNAFLHEGKADLGAVVGKIKALYPDANLKEIMPLLQKEIKKVNSMTFEEIEKEYKKFEDSYELKPKEKEEGLPDLDWAGEDKVVTRFAPNPNGLMHLGHARAAYMSYAFAEKYLGKFILRFEDTDPKVKKSMEQPEKFFKEDLEWLGCRINEIYFASDRMDLYYEYMKKLLEKEHAYICFCKSEDWREKITAKKACPCRSKEKDQLLEEFEKMKSNEIKEGEAVIRLKTDLNNVDPSVRDWWIARVVNKPNHPRVKDKYHLWPSYMFQSAIDDHQMGVTLIIRGQEHSQNETKQRYLANYFGWVYPHTYHIGRLKLGDMVLSTSKIKEGIDKGLYTGWDDPRLGTITALRRRGFDPRALKELLDEIGVKPNDTTIELKKLDDANNKYVEKKAERSSFVNDAIELIVNYTPTLVVEKDGNKYNLSEGTQTFIVSKKQLDKFKSGETARLRKAYNIKITSKEEERIFADFMNTQNLGLAVVPWLLEGIKVEVVMNDNSRVYGMAEHHLQGKFPDDIIYLETVGYVRVDGFEGEKLIAYFAHK